MGKPVASNIERVETKILSTKINKKILGEFKDYCGYRGYPMNMMLEIFMLQYTNGKFILTEEEILQWKNDDSEIDSLNTTSNKEISDNFRLVCKDNGYFLKHVLTAFMYKLINESYNLEYIANNK